MRGRNGGAARYLDGAAGALSQADRPRSGRRRVEQVPDLLVVYLEKAHRKAGGGAPPLAVRGSLAEELADRARNDALRTRTVLESPRLYFLFYDHSTSFESSIADGAALPIVNVFPEPVCPYAKTAR